MEVFGRVIARSNVLGESSLYFHPCKLHCEWMWSYFGRNKHSCCVHVNCAALLYTVSLIYSEEGQRLSSLWESSSLWLMNRILRLHSNTFFWMNSSVYRYTTITIRLVWDISTIYFLMLFITDCLLCIWVVLQESPGYFLEPYSLFVCFPVQIGQLPCQFQARWSIGDRKRGYEKTEMTKEMNKNWRDWIYRGRRAKGNTIRKTNWLRKRKPDL